MKMYIWECAVNVDYTGGDAVVIAPNLRLAKKKVLNPDNGGSWDSNRPVRNPDRVVNLDEKGCACWYSPGGG